MEFRDTRELVEQAMHTSQLFTAVCAAAQQLTFAAGYSADPETNALVREATTALNQAKDRLSKEVWKVLEEGWKASQA